MGYPEILSLHHFRIRAAALEAVFRIPLTPGIVGEDSYQWRCVDEYIRALPLFCKPVPIRSRATT